MVILQGLELGFTVGPVLFPVLQIIKLGGILCANRSKIKSTAAINIHRTKRSSSSSPVTRDGEVP